MVKQPTFSDKIRQSLFGREYYTDVPRKASKSRVVYSLVMTILHTLHCSLLTLYYLYRSALDRNQVDQLIQNWASSLIKIPNLQFHVKGLDRLNLKKGTPYIYVSNHVSQYDIPILLLALPGSVRMIAKKELFSVPIWGAAMKAAGFVSIDRKNQDAARKDLEVAKQSMKEGIVIWGAPEGTRSKTDQLLPFKKGLFITAIEMGATLIPVGIHGTQNALPPGTLDLTLNEQVSVTIGEPIDTSKYKLDDRNQLISEVRSQIEQFRTSQ